MQIPKHQDFVILCDILQLTIESYRQQSFIPYWLLKRWHPRLKQANYIQKKIEVIKLTATDDEVIPRLNEQLIKLLDEMRYFLSVHTESTRLRSKVQDALLEVLFFDPKHAAKYKLMVLANNKKMEFLNYLEDREELSTYKNYYKKQRSLYGRFINRFSDEEITLVAKNGMINGKLIELYTIKSIVSYGLHHVRSELTDLRKQNIHETYLSLQAIIGYVEKLDFLLHPANEIQNDDAVLIQNARYLLEDILNAVGTDENAKAKHPEHQFLVNACFWVDELFKDARGKIEAEVI